MYRNILARVAGCGLGILLACAPGISLAETTLRAIFTPGQKLVFRVENQSSTQLGPLGKTDQKMIQEIVAEVVAVDESKVADLKLTIRRIALSTTLPPPLNQKISFDSDKEHQPQLANPAVKQMVADLLPIIGGTMTMKVSELGEISELIIDDKLIRHFETPSKNPLGSVLNADQLKELAGNLVHRLPKEAVSQGDTWHRQVSLKNPLGTAEMDFQYTYVGPRDDPQEEIEVTGTGKFTPDENAAVKGEPKDLKTTGVLLFDRKLGQAASYKMSQQVELTIELAGQKFNTVTDSTTTFTLLQDETQSESDSPDKSSKVSGASKPKKPKAKKPKPKAAQGESESDPDDAPPKKVPGKKKAKQPAETE